MLPRSLVPRCAVFALALGLAAGCSESPSAAVADTTDEIRPLDPSSVIAYENFTVLGSSIYVMKVDGSGMTRLTPFNATTQSWSPDGTRIAFSSTKDGNYELYVMQADGSNIVRLTNTPAIDESSPAWSPDGASIVYLRSGPELWIMSSTGANPRALTASGLRARYPSWSPDGTRIAFAASDSIMTIRPDGTGLSRIGPNVPTSLPAWSPDGKRVAYIASIDGNVDIYSMRSDGTDVRRLTTDPARDSEPSWSPDGSHIVFSTLRDIASHVYTMRADGTEQLRIPNQGPNNGHPVWRP